MGSCTRRHFLLTICFFQLITIIERQVFDFLGFMWAPILANFFHIIFVIFGFFGVYQYRAKYIVTYGVWNVFWIGWNVFLVCFYLSVGILDKTSVFLNLGSVSWFEANGYGCQPIYSANLSEVPVWPVRPERVENCLLEYDVVELIHSGAQLLLSVLAILGGLLIAKMFYDEDDRLNRGSGKSAKHRQSLYSIEFSPPVDNIRGRSDELLDYDDTNDHRGGAGPPLSPKPMTPRRVKRRSVMTRGTTNRQSTTSRRSQSAGPSSSARTSQRSSRRKYHQNPVTKLIDQQQQQQHGSAAGQRHPTFQRSENPSLTESNLKYLNKDVSSGTGPVRPFTQSANNLNTFHTPHSPHQSEADPIYYNMDSNAALLQQHAHQVQHQQQHLGHFNPTYQHSNPNLVNVPPETPDDLYSNRPPSVRSSYSNFHGARHLSSYNSDNENVFVGLNAQQQTYGHSHPPPPLPPQPQSHPNNHHHNQNINLPPPPPPLASVATSQPLPIPHRKHSASRESVRSMAFLSNGPPAYNLNYHTPPDSETTM